ncbi:MAG: hypothetical protein HYR56_10405 [Acidobacteria bacterium]|nr:hypothetical protein [Acidobacteriota bacterium]
MPSVNVTELHYLQQVRQGQAITIKEHNRAIARLVPVAPAPTSVVDYDKELLELAAQGIVKLPKIPLTAEDVEQELKRKLPRLRVKGKAARELMQRIWDEERGEGQMKRRREVALTKHLKPA